MNKRQLKISFCTVSMNRLHHLQQTLPVNLEDNAGYQNLEFVLVDYNSTDGMEDYIAGTMREYLRTGRLAYYRTKDPEHFHRSHSRNLAFRLATGEVLCNVDADNFTGKDFATYIDAHLRGKENAFLSSIRKGRLSAKKDVLGRICIPRDKFLEADGYDEGMSGYGFEDHDLVNRLEMLGSRRLTIEEAIHLQAIGHSDEERISEEHTRKYCHKVLVAYLTPSRSDIIFLFEDHTFCRGTIQDNYTLFSTDFEKARQSADAEYQFDLGQKEWARGRWECTEAGFVLSDNGGRRLLQIRESGAFHPANGGADFYLVNDEELVSQAIFFYSQLTNRLTMKKNMLGDGSLVNNGKFGVATVYRNFDYQHPILT